MRSRPTFLIGLCLLLAGAWLFWPSVSRRAAQKNDARQTVIVASKPVVTSRSASTAPLLLGCGNNPTNGAVKTNQFAWRLSNTKKSIGQLENDPRAVLLENALIDTGVPLNFSIPKNLRASGDPGAYIVQANEPINNTFRALLVAAGAQIVSYIPNNAYLVAISAGGAAGLSGQPGVQSVLPYEPYYKISSSLLGLAAQQENLPDNTDLTLGLFANNAPQTIDQIKQLGATVLATDQSPFGPIVRVQPPANWTALATLPGVQIVEALHRRALANDLARVTMGISADTVTPTNYMNLTGQNVLVEVNDTGVDATHLDFSATGTAETGPSGASRVIGDAVQSLTDTNGHGTHVAGIIAGNGSESYTLDTNEPQGSVTNADFRGKAPLASLYVVGGISGGNDTNFISDGYLQAVPALTNALISNNSWGYVGDNTYDLAAASYDAAVRDALPLVTGSQPVLFVFAAGNDGAGNDDGVGGSGDTIQSPGTAKNVITVGALEQLRNITNTYTPLGTTNPVTAWYAATDSSNEVAGYSARGNVGIGSEGAFGRFKPDVVAPGSFVVSTRSSEWDQVAYYNPTNYYDESIFDQFVDANSQNNYSLSLNFAPPNTTFYSNIVAVNILIVPNENSPSPFPNLPIYVSDVNYPNPTNPASYNIVTTNNQVSIPPDGGGGYLTQIQGGNLFYTIVNTNDERVGYDLIVEITTTNENGNYFTVLSNLNDTLAPWYRYESGTSMATPAVSGTLALMQDYFTNTLHATPSPALLKAMLINGARPVEGYTYAITNGLNYEGWGLANLPDSLPSGINNNFSAPCSTLFMDQSPTNSLATGDSQSFMVTVGDDAISEFLPLEVTLAWTDPPGNPAAAIKLVNNLELMVSNNVTGDVYFGNDIAPGLTYNQPWDTNTAPNLDSINNVQNVILQPLLSGSYTVTIIGRSVNVNAVTAQTNNVVQDYALVVACGEGEVTDAITVAPATPPTTSNPTSDQQITLVGISTNGIATNSAATGGVFLGQLAGANTPLLGTNTVGFAASTNLSYATNAIVTTGMTNQWHFYVVQNTTGFTNAAFVTFLPDTLSIPRMGVYQEYDPANATQPEADIDLYVTTDSNLLTLSPVAISNCVNGTQVGVSAPGPIFNGASLSRGGTEFVADTGSGAGEIYYVGVKSETSEGAEYGFLPVFSQQPFSEGGGTNIETVNGLLLPVNIPDGSPAHPGVGYVFALALQPIQVQNVIVSNSITHQNFGDLTGTLSHDGKEVVLNNHDSLGNPPGPYNFIYDDGPMPVAGSQPPDGPGSLQTFQGQQGTGPWILTEVDNSLTQTGAVTGFALTITPHQDLLAGITVTITNGGYFYGYIDVPAGTTNLTISATNITLTPDLTAPGQLFEKLGEQPEPPPASPTNYDKMVTLTNGTPPGGSISIGPSDNPPIQPGRYYVTLYNPSTSPQVFYIVAKLGIGQVQPVDFNSTGPVPLLDDAVSYAYITNNYTAESTNETIAEIGVGIRVDHLRISDLVFHLISPDGTRYLLMENRGNTSTNGAGVTVFTTNIVNGSSSGGSAASTNIIDTGHTSGILPITYDFETIPDTMAIYYEGNLIASFTVSETGSTNIPYGPGTSTQLEIVMNPGGNSNTNTYWTYVAGGISTNFYYLSFTEDTNLTTTPIKFGPTPFVPAPQLITNSLNTNSVLVYSNLYYQPEQDMSDLIGTSAYGLWQLEVQDDRVGATNNTVLDGWQMQFVFADTNPVPASLTPGLNCNTAPANGIWWYQVNVPLNAVFATNTLFSADSPVNLLINTSASTNGSVTLLSNQTNGMPVIGTNSVPPLVPGSTYYLGVQNPNGVPVDACIEVDFDLLATAYAFTEPAQLVTGTSAQLNGMATPNGNASFAWFQWGTNTAYGNQTPSVNVGAGYNVVYTTNLISGLTPNLPYHFRLVVSNALGVVYGFDQMLDEANVAAWGANYAGQINVPVGVSNVVTIAGAYDHSLAVNNNGAVSVWGDNTYGQTNVPAGLNNAVAVAGGQSYSLALRSLGTVVAWGSDIYPGAGETNVPAGLSNVVLIASGQYSSLALKADGTLTNWGASLFNTNVPPGLSNVVSMAGGSLHSLAIRNDGTVAAWGDDGAGQTDVPVGLNNVVAVAAGSFHSLALKSDGTVVAWGYDSAGQTNVPAGLSNVVAIAAGGFNSMALKSDGSVVAWGDDSAGQSSVPPGLSGVVAIASGYLQSLALTPVFIANPTNPVVLNLSGGVAQTNTIFGGGVTYYQVTVPTNADFATNQLLFALQGPLNIWFTTNSPPSIATASQLLGGLTNGASVLSTGSAPTNIVPGAVYYLGVQNTNSFAVTYGIQVNFHLIPTAPITNYPISGVKFTSMGGTNGILLTWYAPTNYQFQIQWTTSLTPPISWTTVPGAVPTLVPGSVTNGLTGTYQWFDNFSLTGGFGTQKFYRLIAYPPGVPVPPQLIISSVQAFPGGGISIQWPGSTNYLYDVLWTTNLALPASNWNVLSNLVPPVLTYTGGVYTFTTNTVTLTGGAASAFFLILELP